MVNMAYGFFGEEIGKEWIFKTNVSKDHAQEALKEYERTYRKGNVLLGYDAFGSDNHPLPNCNVIYVHKRALKHL